MKIKNRSVIDAKSKIILRISQKDCDLGNTKDPTTCAAARALCRQEHAKEAIVHLSRAYVKRNDGSWVRYQVPASVRSEIISFDRGGSFLPGEYTLKPIRPSLKLNAKRKPYVTTGTHPQRGRRAKQHMVAGVRSHGNTVRSR